MQELVKDLNRVYCTEPALHQVDQSSEGFEWIDMLDAEKSIISFIRKAKGLQDHLVFVFNFTPAVHQKYKVGVLDTGGYEVLHNSDRVRYGGSNVKVRTTESKKQKWHHRPAHISITIPPLAGLILKPELNN